MSKPLKDRSLCSGCRDNYYNLNREGGCWSFESGKLVQRVRVGVWQNPPYEWLPEWRLNCYMPEGSVMLPKDDCRVRESIDGKGGA